MTREELLVHPRRCQQIKVDGAPCLRFALAGSTVCSVHGGLTPLAKHAAKRRLLALVEPALDTLLFAMENADLPTAVRAAVAILDRAGHGPNAILTVEDKQGALSELSDRDLLDRIDEIRERLLARHKPRDGEPVTIDVTPTQVQ